MTAEIVRHCPGCAGYARDQMRGCPGIPEAAGEFTMPDVVPPLSLPDRIRVLLGRPVFLGVRVRLPGEPFEVSGPDPAVFPPGWAGEIERWKDIG